VTATASVPILFGSDAKVIDLIKFPKMAYTRVFASPGGGIPSVAKIPLTVKPHASFKDVPTPALVNPWLAALTRPVFLTYHHEPEGDISPTAYKAGWTALAQLVKAHPNGHFVTLVEIFTQYAQVHKKSTQWGIASCASLWSGKAEAMGWDCYLEHAATAFVPPATFFSGLLAAAKAANVPFMVPELDSIPMASDHDGSVQAAWLTSCAAYLKANGAIAVSVWDNVAGGNYVKTAKPLAAWQAVVNCG
jgi:hypothetical protein